MDSFGPNFRHDATYFGWFHPSHQNWETLQQDAMNIHRHQFGARFTVLRQGKHLEESFFLRRMAIESTIVKLDFFFLLFREPPQLLSLHRPHFTWTHAKSLFVACLLTIQKESGCSTVHSCWEKRLPGSSTPGVLGSR